MLKTVNPFSDLRTNIEIGFVIYCRVEQLVAREAHNLEVGGSNPPPATSFKVFTSTSSDENDRLERQATHLMSLRDSSETCLGHGTAYLSQE